jgi:hypothetical protein
MPRIDIEEVAIWEAILLRLQTQLVLNARQCYLVADPNYVPSLPVGGDYFVTVAGGEGNFIEGEQIPSNCTEETVVTVSAYTRIKTDSTGHDGYLLLDDVRGLKAIKKKILAALVGQDAEDSNGANFLRQLIYAKTATSGEVVTAGKTEALCGRIQITFGLMFDWDLT